MKAPTLKVGSKTYIAKEPKTKLWRKIVLFNKNYSAVEDLNRNIEAYEAILDIIVDCYNSPQVTAEVVEDTIPLSEIIPTFVYVTNWVATLLASQAEGIPEKN